jgi:cell wall-associated NlpC family hydrolase
MTVAQKRWLSATGAVQTQALMATKVYVLATSGTWTKIAVSTQPSPKNSHGYPGWVPTKQLTARPPATAKRLAIVRAPTTRLWSGWGPGGVTGRLKTRLSYGTRLPVLRVTSTYVVVVTMLGNHRALPRSAVVVHTVGAPYHPLAGQILTDARSFLGLQYLWGGTSGFGFDCSGLTYSLYRRAGITIPRDASVQATHGVSVGRDELRLGDLLFVDGGSGSINHVVMYAGVVSGRRSVIESPRTGVAVRIVPLTTYTYTGARRYLST